MSDRGRIETNAEDYFGHQQKKANLADRRPVIRKASDLVGPGIGLNAVRLANFNDPLATYDGYYSASAGATNAPPVAQEYAGFITSDATLGGAQVFHGLSDGLTYHRVFTRSPLDQSAIFWGDWFVDTPVTAVEARADVLEDRATALEDRATILEGEVKPLYTGLLFFFMTGVAVGGTAQGDAVFPVPFDVPPAAWGIKAGFVTGSAGAVVDMVDNVTTTQCRVTVTNRGAGALTFTGLPVRWFAQAAD